MESNLYKQFGLPDESSQTEGPNSQQNHFDD